MRAGAVLLLIGLLLTTLIVPVIIYDIVVYEYKSVDKLDFAYTNGTFSYTFRDIGPGELEIDAGMQAFLGDMLVQVIYEGGEVVASLRPEFRVAVVRDPYHIEETVEISKKGDYTIKATYEVTTIVLDPYDPDFDIEVTYRGAENENIVFGTICCSMTLGVICFVLVVTGLILLTVGEKKKKVFPAPLTRNYGFQDIRRTPVVIKSRMEKFLLKEEKEKIDPNQVEWEK